MKTVAVLYCDPRGPYPSLSVPGVWLECWGLPHRDAKAYGGPWPVVAHPPCGPWSKLSAFCTRQDKSCALRAVDQVRKWGGVLEHPEGSRLWDAAGLPRALRDDEYGGYTIVVDQCDWGHLARKRTWLYLRGVSFDALENPPSREPTHVVSSLNGAGGGVLKECTHAERRRTPPDFARYLVKLAATAGRGKP